MRMCAKCQIEEHDECLLYTMDGKECLCPECKPVIDKARREAHEAEVKARREGKRHDR